VSCSLDSDCKLSLMLCASTCNSSGKNLASFRNVLAKLENVLVIDELGLFCTEVADLLLSLSAERLLHFFIHFKIPPVEIFSSKNLRREGRLPLKVLQRLLQRSLAVQRELNRSAALSRSRFPCRLAVRLYLHFPQKYIHQQRCQ